MIRKIRRLWIGKLWIVGKLTGDEATKEAGRGPWEFQGVFSTRRAAVAACRDGDYFVGPAALDESLPHEAVSWDGAFYPLAGGTEVTS